MSAYLKNRTIVVKDNDNRFKILTINPFGDRYLVSIKHTVRYNRDDPKASDGFQITIMLTKDTLRDLANLIGTMAYSAESVEEAKP